MHCTNAKIYMNVFLHCNIVEATVFCKLYFIVSDNKKMRIPSNMAQTVTLPNCIRPSDWCFAWWILRCFGFEELQRSGEKQLWDKQVPARPWRTWRETQKPQGGNPIVGDRYQSETYRARNKTPDHSNATCRGMVLERLDLLGPRLPHCWSFWTKHNWTQPR